MLISQIEGELSSKDVPTRGILSSIRLVFFMESSGEGFWVVTVGCGCGNWSSVGSWRKIVIGFVAVIYVAVVEVICLLSRSMMTKGFS